MKNKLMTALMFVGCLTVNAVAYAVPPFNNTLDFTCPQTSGDPTTLLTNFGKEIMGNGTENVNGTTAGFVPGFSGKINSSMNIPADLSTGGYSSSSATYSPNNGVITCSYTSSLGFDSFSVSYKTVNAIGGYTTASTASSISIAVPMGLR